MRPVEILPGYKHCGVCKGHGLLRLRANESAKDAPLRYIRASQLREFYVQLMAYKHRNRLTIKALGDLFGVRANIMRLFLLRGERVISGTNKRGWGMSFPVSEVLVRRWYQLAVLLLEEKYGVESETALFYARNTDL